MVDSELVTPQDKTCPIMTRAVATHGGQVQVIGVPCQRGKCALWWVFEGTTAKSGMCGLLGGAS